MRKTTLFACLLLLTFVAKANASYDHSPRLVADETTSTGRKLLRLMPAEPPVIELMSESQMDKCNALSQNAPPIIRDGRTDKPPVPQPVLSPTGSHLVPSAVTQPGMGRSFVVAGFLAAGFMPDGTPIIRDGKSNKPPVPAPVPPPPPAPVKRSATLCPDGRGPVRKSTIPLPRVGALSLGGVVPFDTLKVNAQNSGFNPGVSLLPADLNFDRGGFRV